MEIRRAQRDVRSLKCSTLKNVSASIPWYFPSSTLEDFQSLFLKTNNTDSAIIRRGVIILLSVLLLSLGYNLVIKDIIF